MVNVVIDGKEIHVPPKTTILDAAKAAGIHVPTLCFLRNINEIGACRICVVEVEGYERLFTACNNPVEEGMIIHTNSRKAREARRNNLLMILSEHDVNCTLCVRSGNCELQQISNELNIHDSPFRKQIDHRRTNADFPLIRDFSRCIKCMRCVQVCDNIQHTNVWDVVNTGQKAIVDVKGVYALEDSRCTLCGQCITHCPTAALIERDDTQKVLDAIDDPEKIVLVQIAPAPRTAWGEEFGMKPQVATVNRLAVALRMAGIDYVFDTNFSADLTIMEEGSEFIERLKNADSAEFPMFTSCCPGWVRYVKGHWPQFVDRLSSAKSPQQMFGAVAKTWYAQTLGVDPSRIFSVSVMPCLAKKAECALPIMNSAGSGQDVDVALTTREVGRLIRSLQIHPEDLKDEPLDMPFGIGSGAGAIFGATGGVMEAALRSAYYLVTGKNAEPDAFKGVRGMEGWKEAQFDLAGKTLKVAVVNGLGNADALLTALAKGKVHYDFVEVMACPGGCVGGGGQPIHGHVEMAPLRAPTLYDIDRRMKLRFSHENPSIIRCYREFLGKPLSERSHRLLHTTYHDWKLPGEK